MAEVFLAHDTSGRLVALKRLLTDDLERLDLFLDEAKIAARFAHPNIVRVHELGCDEEGLYLSLEYVDGHPLSAIQVRARRGPPMPRHLGAYIVAEIARALDHVHRATGADGESLGIVHRDVTAPNVLVSMAGDVKLTDFGIAKAREAAHRTRTGVIRGTAAYMSPEQLAGQPVDARSDVWSAGVLLWETTLGKRLFVSDDLGAIQTTFAAGIPRPTAVDPAYPAQLEAVVMAALEIDPARRCDAAALDAGLRAWSTGAGEPPCRAELAAAMTGWFAELDRGKPAAVDAATRRLGLPRPAPRRRRVWLAGALVLVVLAAVLLAVAARPAAHRDPPPARPIELDTAWRLAQRGIHGQARLIVDELVDARPHDPEVATLAVLVHWWIGTRRIDPLIENAEAARLTPVRRALVRGIKLLHDGRDAEAVLAMEAADRRHPGTAELAFAVGEARWHAGDREGGVAALTEALRRDPTWQMALHHVIDFRTARGEPAELRELAAVLARVDPGAARALEVTARIAERRYPDAVAEARLGTEQLDADAPLWQARAAAEVLAGDLAAARVSIERALALWPYDESDRGPFLQWAELSLLEGDEARFEEAVGGRWAPSNLLRLALWHDGATLKPDPPDRDAEGPRRRPLDSAMSAPPLFECVSMLGAHHHGTDLTEYWSRSPYPEVREFGAGLAAVRVADLVAAEAHFAAAFSEATAETRPLLAYYLARTRYARGDAAGAARACDEVIRPRWYVSYRAVLLRDCRRWSEAAP